MESSFPPEWDEMGGRMDGWMDGPFHRTTSGLGFMAPIKGPPKRSHVDDYDGQ